MLVRDFNKFTTGVWGMGFRPGMLPRHFEGDPWWRWLDHRGRQPRYWAYVKQGACHWLVNFALRLAYLAEPGRQWRIVTSERHSTVWDGHRTLFDLQFYSMGVPAGDAWGLASTGGRQLRPGAELRVRYPRLRSAESSQEGAAGSAAADLPGGALQPQVVAETRSGKGRAAGRSPVMTHESAQNLRGVEVPEMSEQNARLKTPTGPCQECGCREFILWRGTRDPKEQAITCKGCGAVYSSTRPLAPHDRPQRRPSG